MAFSLFCIFESMLLIMNAIAILNDRFLKKSKFICTEQAFSLTHNLIPLALVGFHFEAISLIPGQKEAGFE
jgi:hypothetical protein